MLGVTVEQLDQPVVLLPHPAPVRLLEPVVLQVDSDIVQRRLQVWTRCDTRELRHQAVELRLVPQRVHELVSGLLVSTLPPAHSDNVISTTRGSVVGAGARAVAMGSRGKGTPSAGRRQRAAPKSGQG